MADLKVNVDIQGYNGLEQLGSTMQLIEKIAGQKKLYFATQEAREAFLGLITQAEALEQKMSKTSDQKMLKSMSLQLGDVQEQLREYAQAAVYGGQVISGTFSKSISKATETLQHYNQMIVTTENEIDKLGGKMSNMSSSDTGFKAAQAEMKALQTHLSDYKTRAQEASEGLASLRAAQSAFGRSSVSAESSMDAFIRKLQQVPTVGEQAQMSLQRLKYMAGDLGYALIGGLGFEQLTQRIFSTRSQFQQLEIAFGTMLQDTGKANTLMNQLITTAAKTPFDMMSITSGAKQLLAYGTAANEVNEILTRLGDISAGLGVPLNDLVYLYGTTMTQGRMYTMDLRQFMGRGIPMAEQLAKQFGVSKDEVGKLVTEGKVGAEDVKKAIIGMTSEGSKFGGLMEKRSASLEGRWSNIGDSIQQMFNEIGKSSEPVFNKALDFIAYMVDHWQTIGKLIGTAIVALGTYKTGLMIAATIQKNQLLDPLRKQQQQARETISQSQQTRSFSDISRAQKSIREEYAKRAASNLHLDEREQAEYDKNLRARGEELEKQGILNKGTTDRLMREREITRELEKQASEMSVQDRQQEAHNKTLQQNAENEKNDAEAKAQAEREAQAAEAKRLAEQRAEEARRKAEQNAYSDRNDLAVATYRESNAKRNVRSTKSDYLAASEEYRKQQFAVGRMGIDLGASASLDPTYQAEIEKLNQLRQKREETKNAYLAAIEQEKAARKELYAQQIVVDKQPQVQKAAAERDAAKATYEQDKADLAVQERKLEVIKQQIAEQKDIINYVDGSQGEGGYQDAWSDDENDRLAFLQERAAKQQSIVDEAKTKTEESYQAMKDAQDAWTESCIEGVDKQQAQAEAAKETSDDVKEQVESLNEASRAENENATAKDTNTLSSESNSVAQDTENVSKVTGTIENDINTISEDGNSVAKDTNSLASDTNATSQDTENLSKATGTTENATNTTSEQTNSVAKDKNAVSSNTSSTAQGKENTAKNLGTVANGKETTSENVNTEAKGRNTLATNTSTTAHKIWRHAIDEVTNALNRMKESLMTNPITALITLILSAISAFTMFSGILDIFRSKEDEAADSMANAADSASTKVNTLFSTLKVVDENSQVYKETVNELTETYKRYGITLDDTIMKVGSESEKKQELIAHEKELTDAIRTEAIEREKANQIQTLQENYSNDTQENWKKNLDEDDDLTDSQKQQAQTIMENTREYQNLVEAQKEYNAAVEQFGYGSAQQQAALAKQKEALAATVPILQEIVNRYKDVHYSQAEARNSLSALSERQAELDKNLEDASTSVENAAKAQDGYNASLKDAQSEAVKAAKDQEQLSYWYDTSGKSAKGASGDTQTFGKDITDWVDASVAKANDRLEHMSGIIEGTYIPGMQKISTETGNAASSFGELGLQTNNVSLGFDNAGSSANTLGINISGASDQTKGLNGSLYTMWGTAENASAQLETMVPPNLDAKEAFPKLLEKQNEVIAAIDYVNTHPTKPEVDATRLTYLNNLLDVILGKKREIEGKLDKPFYISQLEEQNKTLANKTDKNSVKQYAENQKIIDDYNKTTAKALYNQSKKDEKTAESNAKKAETRRAQEAKRAKTAAEQAARQESQRQDARLKAEQQYENTRENFIKDAEERVNDTRIKMMREGMEKDLAQIENETQKQLEALDERYRKLGEAAKKRAETLWLNEKGQGKNKRTEADWLKTEGGKKTVDDYTKDELQKVQTLSADELMKVREQQEEIYRNSGFGDIIDQLRKEFNGNVDVVNRPVIDTQNLKDKGWENVGDGIATFFSSSHGVLDDKGQEHEVLITPILPDGSVLSKKELQEYVGKVLNGKDILKADTKGLVISLDTDLDGIQADRLHELSAQLTNNDAINKAVQQLYSPTLQDNYNQEYAAIIANRQKELNKLNEESAKSFNEYLKQFGSMQEQRLAIEKEYDEKIAKARTEGDRLTLNAQKTRALSDFDIKNQKSDLNWESIFGNLDSFTKGELEGIKEQLRGMLSSGELDLQGYKEVVEQIDKVNDAILTAEDKQRGFLGVAISYNTERRKLEMDVADATERQAQAYREMTSARIGLDMQKSSVQQTLGGIGFTVSKDKITTANSNNILKQVGNAYGTDSEQYAKVRKELEELAGSEVKYNNAVKKNTKATDDASTANRKLKDHMSDFAKKLGDLMPLFQKISANIQDIPELLSTFGVSEDSSLGKAAQGLADGTNSAMSAMQDYMSGNYVGAVMNGMKAVGSYVSAGINLFAGAGNAEAMEAEIAKLSEANSDLAAAIDGLKESITKSDNTNQQSVEAYQKAVQAEKEREANQRTMISDRAREYSNTGHGFLGMGGKSSFNVYANRNRGNWLDAFNEALRQNGYSGNLKSAEDVWKLSPEEMKILRDFSPEAWTKFFNSGGESNPKELAEEYIEMAGQLEDLTDSLNEKLTGYSLQGFKDSYESLLEDLENSTSDFGDNINDIINKAVIKSIVNTKKHQKEIEAIYQAIADAAQDDIITDEEANRIRQMNEDLAKELTEERQKLIDAGLIKTDSYSQKASSGTYQTMSQETGEELNGRFTAVQEAVEGIWLQVMEINSKMGTEQTIPVTTSNDDNAGSETTNVATTQLLGIADEGRTILAQQLMEIQAINERQGDWERPLRTMWSQIKDIRDDIRNKL